MLKAVRGKYSRARTPQVHMVLGVTQSALSGVGVHTCGALCVCVCVCVCQYSAKAAAPHPYAATTRRLIHAGW
jgi:hypothetical protein